MVASMFDSHSSSCHALGFSRTHRKPSSYSIGCKPGVAALCWIMLALAGCRLAAAQSVCNAVVPVCKPEYRRRLTEDAAAATPPPLPPADPNGVPQKYYDPQPLPVEDAAKQKVIIDKLNQLMPGLQASVFNNTNATATALLAAAYPSPSPAPGGNQPDAAAVPKATTSSSSSSSAQQNACSSDSDTCSSGDGAAPPATISRGIPNSAAPAADVGPYKGPATQLDPFQLTYLENAKIKVGLDLDRAGTISWVSSNSMPKPWTGKNLINIWDCGRLLQQSYYGCLDGSCWYDRPWLWNPVQGGSWQNFDGYTLNSTVIPGKRILAHANPRNWGGQDLASQMVVTTDITLQDNVIVVNYTMRYNGIDRHPMMTQETPAVFTNRNFSVLAFYDGMAPFKNQPVRYAFPGGRNMYAKPTERWAAYIDPNTGAGLGVFVPAAWMGITAYRTGPDNTDRPYHTSYFAHTIRMALTPGQRPYSYAVYITTGRLDDIRRTFNKLAMDPKVMPPELIKDIAALMKTSQEPVLGIGQPDLGRASLAGRLAVDTSSQNMATPAPVASQEPSPALGQTAADGRSADLSQGAGAPAADSAGASTRTAVSTQVIAGAVAGAAGLAVVALIVGTVALTKHLRRKHGGELEAPAAPAGSEIAAPEDVACSLAAPAADGPRSAAAMRTSISVDR